MKAHHIFFMLLMLGDQFHSLVFVEFWFSYFLSFFPFTFDIDSKLGRVESLSLHRIPLLPPICKSIYLNQKSMTQKTRKKA